MGTHLSRIKGHSCKLGLLCERACASSSDRSTTLECSVQSRDDVSGPLAAKYPLKLLRLVS